MVCTAALLFCRGVLRCMAPTAAGPSRSSRHGRTAARVVRALVLFAVAGSVVAPGPALATALVPAPAPAPAPVAAPAPDPPPPLPPFPPPPPTPPSACLASASEPTWETRAWWPAGLTFRCGCNLETTTWDLPGDCAVVGDLLFATSTISQITSTPYFSSTWLTFRGTSAFIEDALNGNTPLCDMDEFECDNGRVISVLLSGRNLTGTLPASFSQLTSIRSLDLSDNPGLLVNTSILSHFTQLNKLVLAYTPLSGPLAALRSLSNLVTAYLIECGLTGALDGSLFAPMTGLQNLYLSSNSLSLLTNVSLLPPSLEDLQVDSNALTGLLPSAGWCRLTALTSLDLSNNQLSGSIPSLSCMNLTYLDLKSNAFTGVLGDDIVNAMDVCVSPCGRNSSQPPCKDMYLGLAANQLSGTVPVSLTHTNKSCIRQISVETPISVCAAGAYQSGTTTITSTFPSDVDGEEPQENTWLKASCQQCSPGSFSAQPGAVSCSPCSAGYVSNQNFTGCVPCDAGKFLNQGACVPCGTGSISSAGSVACSLCPLNTYTNGSDYTRCVACPLSSTSPAASGTLSACKCALGSIPVYTANSSSTFTCTPCPAGSYYDISTSGCRTCGIGSISSAGSVACSLCPLNTYTNGSDYTACVACPLSSTSPAASGLLSACKCALGSIPAYANSSSTFTCTECPAGSYYDTAGIRCVPCGIGSISNAGSVACSLCPLNTYTSGSDYTRCVACPLSSTSPAASGTLSACKCALGSIPVYTANSSSTFTCTPCPAGSYYDISTSGCRTCGNGSYSSASGSTSCVAVDAGYVANANSTGQTPCPAGTALNAQSGDCKPCATGSYSALAGATACTLVDPGFVSTAARTGQSACPAGTALDAVLLACVACAPGTYTSSAASSKCASCFAGTIAPLQGATGCQACPSNSRDVAAYTACLCSAGYFDAQLGANSSSPACAACTEGGVCDGTTGELLADEGYWRESDNDTVFFKCREGYCLAENSSAANSSTARRRLHQASSNSSSNGGHCTEGHGGVLCAVCQEGYSMQGGFCKACDAKDSWSSWSTASKAVLCAFMVPAGALAITLLLLLPLLPACERGLQVMTDALGALAARVQRAVAAAMRCPARCFACLCVRKTEETPAELVKGGGVGDITLAAAPVNTPTRGGALLLKAGTAPSGILQAAPEQKALVEEGEAPDQGKRQGDRSKGGGVSDRRLAAAPVNNPMVSALALQLGIASSGILQASPEQEASAEEELDQGDFGEGGILDTLMLVDAGGADALLDSLSTLFNAVSRPAKIIINFFQITSTFIQSLDVPWPRTFTYIQSRANVINLNLVELPKTACLHPNTPFFDQFNGYTLGLSFGLALIGLIWGVGHRLIAPASLHSAQPGERAQRERRFRTLCLSRALLLLYLVYPGVSGVVIAVFNCRTLASGKAYLVADHRQQCWTPLHWSYVTAGIFWLLAVPIGIPVTFMLLLYYFRVPQMAKVKVANAWLQEAVEHTWRLGEAQPACDVQTLGLDNISDEHLELLVAVLVNGLRGEEVEAERVSASSHAHGEDGATPRSSAGESQRLGFLRRRTPAATPSAQMNCRRLRLQKSLLRWCKTSGTLSLPPLTWDEVEDDLDDSAAKVREEQELAATKHSFRGSFSGSSTFNLGSTPASTLKALEQRALRKVGFLFEAYTVQTWYWESVELMRKLILTSILAVVAPGSAAQVTVGVLVSFAMLLLGLRLRPYSTDNMNFISSLAQVNIFFFLFVGLLLKVRVNGDATDSRLFSGIVIVLSFVPIVLPIGLKAGTLLTGGDGDDADDAIDEAGGGFFGEEE